MSISLKELLGKYEFADLPKDHQDNILDLLYKINKIRDTWGKPMTVSSGYRSMDDHLRIYREKGIVDKSKIPMKSKHLSGLAVDISDPSGALATYIQSSSGVRLLDQTGLWCEALSSTPGWVHFQCIPPASGKRFFLP